jgi:NAD(P)H dehydrogenase (quinone)
MDSVRVQQVEAMRTIMIGDRINARANSSEMIVFDEMTRGYDNEDNRLERGSQFLAQAYNLGFEI